MPWKNLTWCRNQEHTKREDGAHEAMNMEATATIAWETRGTTLLASVLIDRFASRGFTAKLSSDLHSFRVCMVYGLILAWLESGARPAQACPVLATDFF